MTNADKIRNMTDEELRDFICENTNCQTCKFCTCCGCDIDDWLKKPYEGDEY